MASTRDSIKRWTRGEVWELCQRAMHSVEGISKPNSEAALLKLSDLLDKELDKFQPDQTLAVDFVPHIWNDADFRACMKECDKILTVKGHDYTSGMSLQDEGRLRNFDQAAVYLKDTPFKVLGVYLYKHITAVLTFCGQGSVESEPIEGRIFDVINYCTLLFKMVKRAQRNAAQK